MLFKHWMILSLAISLVLLGSSFVAVVCYYNIPLSVSLIFTAILAHEFCIHKSRKAPFSKKKWESNP